MFNDLPELGEFPAAWKRKHLLGLEDLTREELLILLDKAQVFRDAFDQGRRKFSILPGHTSVTLFFENSTRTRTSFTLAAQRLGASCVAFAASTSSLSKGESIVDTAKNLEAMGCESMVVRHSTPGIPKLLSENVHCSIINAGDGAHEHPTQGLLDILT
ncbi:MAG: aspartate carbamoyltransferase, partial [Thermoguttaceae bacterium]